MDELYPEIEPYDHGMLEVGDGNQVYWETCGNPAGTPAVFLHGGPGGGCSPRHRRMFDPDRYRLVLFDQRGCGRSTPDAALPETDLTANTTEHLLADIELLRAHLGIDRWVVCGGSWGSTLALAYAQAHIDRISALIVAGVFTARASELHWSYGGGSAFLFPQAWQRFRDGAPPGTADGDLIEAYHRLLSDPDPQVRERAAVAWCEWEAATVSLRPRDGLLEELTDPEFAFGFARLVTHYFRNAAWLPEGALLRQADALAEVPGAIVQGRWDFQTPPLTAWELHLVWPRAEFTMVEDAGHSAEEPAVAKAMIEATDRFA
ncbi:prolyl aminopeptidase [Solihabitans fulvus]|uniref:Proline iminopeptidase n=1 Tax=Solihabitans fulvus TaxID=1892852 RepID=A0A5B2XBK7_9PSEU|nr:prolyl aminopeptidase [Solihabitans fulvus]KAA2260460.1 prolyl aminopeptidase [Solihabitans fulvus]